ncbi:MAG: DUF5131 family protein [Actinomycetota bacterium]|nr:DUF5131 family protein [Actinomycetota bacterium]
MNRTKIEYCDYTWNPVTGCRHGCWYCYGRRIAERFKQKGNAAQCHDCTQPRNGLHEVRYKGGAWRYGYEPTLYSCRLGEPFRLRKPSVIFVSSMGDLFGEWVPWEWIRFVQSVVEECPQHTFLFLTKNPSRYAEFPFPDNCWLGMTVDTADAAYNRTRLWDMKHPNRFVSLEPLLEDVSNWIDFRGIKVCIIGALTGPQARQPEPEWVKAIIDECRAEGVMVFIKDNLRWPEKIQELPWEVRS